MDHQNTSKGKKSFGKNCLVGVFKNASSL